MSPFFIFFFQKGNAKEKNSWKWFHEKNIKFIGGYIWSADLVVVVLGVWWFWSQIPSKTRGQYSAYWSCLYSNQNRYPKKIGSSKLVLFWVVIYCIYLLSCARMRYQSYFSHTWILCDLGCWSIISLWIKKSNLQIGKLIKLWILEFFLFVWLQGGETRL